jgi:hypothetical protein
MWLWIPDGKEKERLIRVRENHLLDVVGVTGEPGKRTGSRCDRFDAPFPFSDISHEYLVPDSNEVGPAAVPLEDAPDCREQLSAVRQLYGEELAVGSDDHSRQRVLLWRRILFDVPRFIG